MMGFYLKNIDRINIPTGPGIYSIHYKPDPNGTFGTISRAVIDDTKGTLYIGKTYRLRSRIGVFKRVVFKKSRTDRGPIKGHVAADRYIRIRSLRQKFPAETLWVEFQRSRKRKTSDKKEKDALMVP